MVACACKLSILRSEAVKLLAPGSRPAWAKTQFQNTQRKHIQIQSMLQRVSREKIARYLYPQKKKKKNLTGK